VKYVESKGNGAEEKGKKSWGKLVFDLQLSWLSHSLSCPPACHELLNISSFFGCKVASLSLLRTSNKHFAKLNGHASQAHVLRSVLWLASSFV